jgi:hypothetical protein
MLCPTVIPETLLSYSVQPERKSNIERRIIVDTISDRSIGCSKRKSLCPSNTACVSQTHSPRGEQQLAPRKSVGNRGPEGCPAEHRLDKSLSWRLFFAKILQRPNSVISTEKLVKWITLKIAMFDMLSISGCANREGDGGSPKRETP